MSCRFCPYYLEDEDTRYCMKEHKYIYSTKELPCVENENTEEPDNE